MSPRPTDTSPPTNENKSAERRGARNAGGRPDTDGEGKVSDPDVIAQRLRAARIAQKGPEPDDKRGMAIGLRMGVELVAGVLVGLAIGWALDRVLGTEPILLVVFLLFGIAAGLLTAIRSAQQATAERPPEAISGTDENNAPR